MKKTIKTFLSLILMFAVLVGYTQVALAETDTTNKEKESETFEEPDRYVVPDLEQVVLNVTKEKQQNPYYCGPACVVAVVRCLKGSAMSQSYYGNLLRTDQNQSTYIGDIPGVLNSAIGYNRYGYYNNGSASFNSWLTQIKTSIDNGYPVILLIRPDGTDPTLPYTVGSGHFIVVFGYERYTQTGVITGLKFMDPHHNSQYHQIAWHYNPQLLYNANMAHNYKGMVRK